LARAESKKVRAKVDAVQWKKQPPKSIQIDGYEVPIGTVVID
jgi:hypothetical protein